MISNPMPFESPEIENSLNQKGALLILSLGALMISYVELMVVPSIGAFESFFHQPLASVSWILAAYLLVGTAFTPIAGKLGDIYGKKKVILVILIIYLAAVAFAGLSPDIGGIIGVSRQNQLYLLIGARSVQGVGMGLFPLSFAMIGEEFPVNKVAGAQSIVSAMFSVGASLGLIGGAWITQTFGWQLSYNIVIPIALVVLLASVFRLRESRMRSDTSIDSIGSLSLASTIIFFLLSLTEGPTWGWRNFFAFKIGSFPFGVPVLSGISILSLLVFILWERKSKTPIVDFGRLGERNILLTNIAGLMAGLAMFLAYVSVVSRVETPSNLGGLGKTVLDMGLYTIPSIIVSIISAPIIGRGIRRFGPKPVMMAGTAIFGLGGLFLYFFNNTVLDIVMGLIPTANGVIFVYMSMVNMIIVSSKPDETGIQQGMNQTFRNLGNAIGPVIASYILAAVLSNYTIILNGKSVTLQSSSIFAYQVIFAVIAVLGVLGFIITSALRKSGKVLDKLPDHDSAVVNNRPETGRR